MNSLTKNDLTTCNNNFHREKWSPVTGSILFYGYDPTTTEWGLSPA